VEVIREDGLRNKKGDGTLKTMGRPAKTLRIFYASDTTPNAWFATIRSNIWRNNLLLPLRDLGHDVVEFEYDLTVNVRPVYPLAVPLVVDVGIGKNWMEAKP